ncbi:hypothetical protein PG993_007755 [Apiospora rasikravindrae]|uniref:Clr5 domain-containing protein n=1 Tax=Apiospora rasikravindrae TaxID=990691 RepID=A0ABR1SYE1_9PEZI
MPALTKQIRWARPRVDWTDEVRELITELYQRQNLPLKEVVRIMQVEHGFSATETMYKKRIKQWGLWKNLRHSDTTTNPRDQVAAVEAGSGRRDVAIRSRHPHDTRVRGHSIDRRMIQADNVVEISHFAQARHDSALFVNRRPISSVEPTTLKAPDCVRLPEESMHILREYVARGFQTGAWRIEEEGLRDEEWRFDGAGSRTQLGNWAGLSEAGIQLLDQHRTKEAFRVFNVLFSKYRLLLRDKRLFANLFPLTLTVIVNLTHHHLELGRSLARHIHQLCTIIKPLHFPLHDRLMQQLCLMDSETTSLAARRLSDFYMDELESYSGPSQPMITNMCSMTPNLAVHDLRNAQIFIDRAEYLLARLKSRGEEHSYAARYVKGVFAWLHFHTGELERAWKLTAEVLSQPFTAEETEAARDGDHMRLEAACHHLRIYIATKRGDREECVRLIPLAARHFVDSFGWTSTLTVQSHALLTRRLEEMGGGELMAQQMRDEMQAGIEAYCRAEMCENGI